MRAERPCLGSFPEGAYFFCCRLRSCCVFLGKKQSDTDCSRSERFQFLRDTDDPFNYYFYKGFADGPHGCGSGVSKTPTMWPPFSN